MSFPPTGIKCSSETAIFRNAVNEKDEGYCLPSGVASEPSSPIKDTLKNKSNMTSFHGRGVINCTRIEGGRSCTSQRYLARHMELVKDVFPQKCYEESSLYLGHLVSRKGKVRMQGSEFPYVRDKIFNKPSKVTASPLAQRFFNTRLSISSPSLNRLLAGR